MTDERDALARILFEIDRNFSEERARFLLADDEIEELARRLHAHGVRVVSDEHNCDYWRMEGIGCAHCNPIARETPRVVPEGGPTDEQERATPTPAVSETDVLRVIDEWFARRGWAITTVPVSELVRRSLEVKAGEFLTHDEAMAKIDAALGAVSKERLSKANAPTLNQGEELGKEVSEENG